jgi:cell wall-associated NlpC family hydrolase
VSDARLQKLVEWATGQIGAPVLWFAHGDYYVDANGVTVKLPPSVLAFDCSGLVNYGVHALGGPDRRATHTAQGLWNLSPPFIEAVPEVGSLCFWGKDSNHVIHVALAAAAGRIISADGATPAIRSLAEALKNPHNRVRLHEPTIDQPAYLYRRDVPFLGFRRNILFMP